MAHNTFDGYELLACWMNTLAAEYHRMQSTILAHGLPFSWGKGRESSFLTRHPFEPFLPLRQVWLLGLCAFIILAAASRRLVSHFYSRGFGVRAEMLKRGLMKGGEIINGTF
jgi:hypothetical protein